ncbi:hypothetical protein FXO38_24341 [Capsicum annuum]|nr:hypothetical protein FXO38_24341 [Capsicum annuum]KAF3685226.1 hypothetical protein FXO37_00825 [Capsicum annuum]
MLQIRLSKPASESGGGAKSLPPDNVTVACPDHLVLADLPVAKSLGTVNAAAAAASLVKTVGRRSRRQLGDRVHFCVRCDFPIAIYGRLWELWCTVDPCGFVSVPVGDRVHCFVRCDFPIAIYGRLLSRSSKDALGITQLIPRTHKNMFHKLVAALQCRNR